jgi:hypothetical protein
MFPVQAGETWWRNTRYEATYSCKVVWVGLKRDCPEEYHNVVCNTNDTLVSDVPSQTPMLIFISEDFGGELWDTVEEFTATFQKEKPVNYEE